MHEYLQMDPFLLPQVVASSFYAVAPAFASVATVEGSFAVVLSLAVEFHY
jgi:hypothetical protein